MLRRVSADQLRCVGMPRACANSGPRQANVSATNAICDCRQAVHGRLLTIMLCIGMTFYPQTATCMSLANRWNFTMARARTNWQRLQNLRAHLAKYSAGFEKLQSWQNPPASIAAIACTTLLSFYPHNMLACLLVYVMLHSLFMYR